MAFAGSMLDAQGSETMSAGSVAAIMIVRFPFLMVLASFLGLWLCVTLGARLRQKSGPLSPDERDDFNVIQGATLTLLGLIVGFSFSMALSRFDQRQRYERIEADAISTEYLRLDLLTGNTAAEDVRRLLKRFLEERIRWYESSDPRQIEQINRETIELQNELWQAAREEAAQQQTPITALVISGMNDVLSLQGNTQAAWWNRIPFAGWGLMGLIAAFSSAMIGHGARTVRPVRFPIFPLVIAIAFFFIADLDSPYGGFIHVYPRDLLTLADSLK